MSAKKFDRPPRHGDEWQIALTTMVALLSLAVAMVVLAVVFSIGA